MRRNCRPGDEEDEHADDQHVQAGELLVIEAPAAVAALRLVLAAVAVHDVDDWRRTVVDDGRSARRPVLRPAPAACGRSSARSAASARSSARFCLAIWAEGTVVAAPRAASCVERRAAKEPRTTAMPSTAAMRSACMRFMPAR